MTIISLNILPAFASEEQTEERKAFFPQNFTDQQLEQLYTHGEAKDGFKVYKVDGENKQTLYSYKPYKFQVITKYTKPFEGRVNFEQESYETIDQPSFEILPGMESVGTLKKFIGTYTLQGAYEKESTVRISVTGSYDVFRLIFPNESFNENGLCLHRLHELNEGFIKETPNAHRLNQTLSKLFYMKKALQHPKTYPLTYNEMAEELGRKWFIAHMKDNNISDEKCMAVLLKKQDVDPTLISLGDDFYTATVNSLKDDIYSLLGIDKDLLQSMYEGVGKLVIDYNYTLAAKFNL